MDTLNEILSHLPQRVSEEISMLPASVLADLEEIKDEVQPKRKDTARRSGKTSYENSHKG